MISCTLDQYKDSFKTNLLAFLNEYEDNTKSFFLQNEKAKYQAYQKALNKLKKELEKYSADELISNPIARSIAADLKGIDQNIYNSIITELNPVQDESILSLSAARKDRIKIGETTLDNHIKSSILILKFISEENTETIEINKFTYPSEDGETGLKMQTYGQLDPNLEKWLNIYEANFEYLPIPLVIDEKADYVTDTYKNYEQRYIEYQIEVCDTILNTVPNDKTIIEFKKQFEKNLIQLREEFPIPSVNIQNIISDINNAFYRLENFMKGTVSVYQSFLFNDAFTMFFNELNKIENINPKNFNLRDSYHYLLTQIDYAYDKSEFKNQKAYDNDDFNRDCNEIIYLHFDRAAEFGLSSDLDDYKFEMPSIMEIVNNSISGFDQNIDKGLKLKQIIETHDIDNSFDEKITQACGYKVIIDIINHPANILKEYGNDDYIGLDENGIEVYKETSIGDKFDDIKDIKEPFSNLESLTIELMNNTKHQKVLDGYLKLIFRDFMETAVIIIDYCNEYLYNSAKKGKNYPKDLEYFFYTYRSCLESYYDFIVDFLDEEFLKKENKIFIVDGVSHQTVNSLNIQTEKQKSVFNTDLEDKLTPLEDEINPYPRIFKDYYSYTVFKKLLEEFGNEKECLSNYSYVFYKMTYEGLIHFDLLHKTYIAMLSDFDISIDRIKPKGDIGKITLRDSIYSKAK